MRLRRGAVFITLTFVALPLADCDPTGRSWAEFLLGAFVRKLATGLAPYCGCFDVEDALCAGRVVSPRAGSPNGFPKRARFLESLFKLCHQS